MSFNKATLLGNLGRDPEVRSLQNGGKVANISVATSQTWRDKTTGERQEKTEWHRVVVFGPAAEAVEKYLKKGSKVLVDGTIETRSWETDGVKKYATEIVVRGFGTRIVFVDTKHEAAGGEDEPGETGRTSKPAPGPIDDIPF